MAIAGVDLREISAARRLSPAEQARLTLECRRHRAGFHDTLPGRSIEAAGRLVGEDQAGPVDKRPRRSPRAAARLPTARLGRCLPRWAKPTHRAARARLLSRPGLAHGVPARDERQSSRALDPGMRLNYETRSRCGGGERRGQLARLRAARSWEPSRAPAVGGRRRPRATAASSCPTRWGRRALTASERRA